MIRVPFIDASAKIASIIIKTGQDDLTPRKTKLVSERETFARRLADSRRLFLKFVNQDTLDFGDAKDRPCAQELDVPISNDLGEYALKCVVHAIGRLIAYLRTVRPTKFSNVRSVTLFIYAPDADDDDDDRKTRVYFLGFTGTFTKVWLLPKDILFF